jgi:hypothetical protein
VHHVQVRAGPSGQVGSGLDRQRLGFRRMGFFPVGERAFGLAPLQVLARVVDEAAVLAMHAGDGAGAERGHLAESFVEEVVLDRGHDIGDARHVELERAHAVLFGAARNVGELSFVEDLQVKRRVDEAALLDRLLKARQVLEIGVLQAPQEDGDRGHAAEHRGARLGVRLLLESELVADVHVRVDHAGQHHLAARVEHLLGRRVEILPQRDDAAAGDADVGFHAPHARYDERAVAHYQIELRRHLRLLK